MVDAIGGRQGKLAVKLLHQQLSERDPLSLLGMITRQFRLLLQAKEMLTDNATSNEIAQTLKVHEFVARKLTNQCRNFDLHLLEAIYRKLAEVDENIKTGKIEAETALDTLVVGLTT
jgi:DNA polymerase-3 subunit delta